MKLLRFLTENQEIITQVHQFIAAWENEEAVIYTQTSGSTGKPKTITLEKDKMRASALASGSFFQFQEGQVMRLALSPLTIGGKMLLLRGMLHGMQIEVVEPSKYPLTVIEQPIYFLSLVPYQLEQIIEYSPEKLQHVKTVLLGGAPVSSLLKEKIKLLPCAIYESYGMTETMSHVALKNLKNDAIFKAIPGVHFSTNEHEQLLIHAPNLGIDKLLTNDIVTLHSDTEFEWKGRLDFVINSAGVKIHPEIVESKLQALITSRFFIIGEKDATFGERVVLIIEGEVPLEKIPFETVLSKYEIPKEVYYIAAFVETASGKINRLATQLKVNASSIN